MGQCPLIFAMDCEFSVDVCKSLVQECECDVNTADDNGDTLLHYAVNLDNEEL